MYSSTEQAARHAKNCLKAAGYPSPKYAGDKKVQYHRMYLQLDTLHPSTLVNKKVQYKPNAPAAGCPPPKYAGKQEGAIQA